MKFVATHDGHELDVEVQRHGSGYRVRLGDRWIDVDVVAAGNYMQSLRLDDGRQYALIHHREGTTHHISLGGSNVTVDIQDPLSRMRRRSTEDMGGSGIVKALMPGRVVRVLVNKGDTVRKGAGLLILEAMKMENEIQAPADGVVDELFVQPGQTVEGGADLVHIG
ncbi:MAG TPA: biotin/lipoyl-containing protein [Thermoanaerobaculia bacterium]|nr:biotin/lipoyl-containing protein [Thermoanaerobaculia bacterium]